MEGTTEIMAEPVLEEYITVAQKNYISGNDEGKISEKSFLELKGTFLIKIRDNAFSSITSWENLTEKIFGKFYPPSRTNMEMKADEDEVSWDQTDNEFEIWLASKFENYMTIDQDTIKPNGKLIYNSIMHGPYVRRMIHELGDPDRKVSVTETFTAQSDEELTKKELKQVEADDQAIHTILLGLPEDIYVVVDVNELKAEQLARAHDLLALMANSNNTYNYLMFHQDQLSQYTGQNVGNQNGYTVVQNVRNQGIANQNLNPDGNGNVVATRAEGNAIGDNDLEGIKEVNANCILMVNLQQASTSGTQTDNAPVYDSDGSAKVHEYDNCYNNEIFNMFTQEEQYTKLLDPIPEPHQVQQNDSNIISALSSVEQGGGIVEQHPTMVEKIQADESLATHKAFEFEIEHLLRAVASQELFWSILSSLSVVDTSNLQTELDRTKEKLENCIIKKEKEYVVLWNNWLNPFQTSKEEKFVPNKPIKSSVRTKSITVSQSHVITKKHVNSYSNGLSSTGVDNTAKTRRP
ncbi:hypothetical protein Tco_1030471 [Tanacetum coccineum]|uniref:Uncharacterized protein n=1 Tax=Tanacetum coccineum TaxID=301880 RepID=A0ABQ5G6R9_9ASTR